MQYFEKTFWFRLTIYFRKQEQGNAIPDKGIFCVWSMSNDMSRLVIKPTK